MRRAVARLSPAWTAASDRVCRPGDRPSASIRAKPRSIARTYPSLSFGNVTAPLRRRTSSAHSSSQNRSFVRLANSMGGDAMTQAPAFETDFWKDANLRKVWDDIVPGEPRKTTPYKLTLEAIQLYCRSVGEDPPLYFDDTYAKKPPYGGLIAPPSIHILLMFACTPTDDWMRTPGTINAGQSWSYNKPARPGDTITLQARALDKFIKRERLFVVHDNVFFNQHGDVICSGRGQTIRPA